MNPPNQTGEVPSRSSRSTSSCDVLGDLNSILVSRKTPTHPHDDPYLGRSQGHVPEGRPNRIIHTVRGKEPIAEDAEEPRFAEEK
jgi:hypothetical protein